MASKKKKRINWKYQCEVETDRANDLLKDRDSYKESYYKEIDAREKAYNGGLDVEGKFRTYEAAMVTKGIAMRKELEAIKKELAFYKGIFQLVGDHATPIPVPATVVDPHIWVDPLTVEGADEWKREGGV